MKAHLFTEPENGFLGMATGLATGFILLGAAYALAAGFVVYGILKQAMGIRLSDEEEHMGADLAIHKISSQPELDMTRH